MIAKCLPSMKRHDSTLSAPRVQPPPSPHRPPSPRPPPPSPIYREYVVVEDGFVREMFRVNEYDTDDTDTSSDASVM